MDRAGVAVLQAVHNLSTKKTIILTALRLSIVKNCSCIYLPDHGRLAGQGTHAELLQIKRNHEDPSLAGMSFFFGGLPQRKWLPVPCQVSSFAKLPSSRLAVPAAGKLSSFVSFVPLR